MGCGDSLVYFLHRRFAAASNDASHSAAVRRMSTINFGVRFSSSPSTLALASVQMLNAFLMRPICGCRHAGTTRSNDKPLCP